MVFKIAGDVADGEALDQRKRNRSASIGCARGPPDCITHSCLFKRIIKVIIQRVETHHERWIAIQRAQSDAFNNA